MSLFLIFIIISIIIIKVIMILIIINRNGFGGFRVLGRLWGRWGSWKYHFQAVCLADPAAVGSCHGHNSAKLPQLQTSSELHNEPGFRV